MNLNLVLKFEGGYSSMAKDKGQRTNERFFLYQEKIKI